MVLSEAVMRVFFSGIGGVGIGPLAMIAQDAGMSVVGTHAEKTDITSMLIERGIDVELQVSSEHLEAEHFIEPIDWLVYSSAIPNDHPELNFARAHNIRTSKRDEFINEVVQVESLKMIAVAGTHGKTTTTAMIVWLFQQLELPVSYSIGTTISFGAPGAYQKGSEYFVYECDEYDRNFLHYHPYISLVTMVDYDHPDTYPTKDEYVAAFQQFTQQSEWVYSWQDDEPKLNGADLDNFIILDERDNEIDTIKLAGRHNRENAWQAIQVVSEVTEESIAKLIQIMNSFPGTSRRFEKISENTYSDYAHHPAEIRATLQLANELNDRVIVLYQPHQNTRQHAIADEYKDSFAQANKVYWAPTYLTREDDSLPELSPEQLITKLDTNNAVACELSSELADTLKKQAQDGALVLVMGAGPIDGWARENLVA